MVFPPSRSSLLERGGGQKRQEDDARITKLLHAAAGLTAQFTACRPAATYPGLAHLGGFALRGWR